MKSLFLLIVAACLFIAQSSFAEERGLQFLSKIPEFRDLSLKMTEAQLRAHVEKHRLYIKELHFNDPEAESKRDRKSYQLITPEGESVFIYFLLSGACAGIQRMQPIPKQMIENEIGVAEYRAWMERRKKPNQASEPTAPSGRGSP